MEPTKEQLAVVTLAMLNHLRVEIGGEVPSLEEMSEADRQQAFGVALTTIQAWERIRHE